MRDEVNGFPIQLAKVQRPALRDETLERPRLLDWLRVKIHGRVTLILADAGYGKTTLLADFSRRHRLRTLWYRLDDDDRDWVSFLHHLVAAGREYDPSFAPRTASLLAEIGIAGPGRETVLDTFITELPSIAAGGAVLIFDDFHLVDDASDVRHITRELLARGPERLSFAFASRRTPTIPLARLRAIGEVSELGTQDLRFDHAETSQLFTETYGRRLDPDVLADLATRTEGWIASLQMVQAALRDRSPAEIRRFVRGLTGADHELYDYLAEEVVGDLGEEVQRFIMETAVLQIVTPELAEVASRRETADVARLLGVAENLTLLGRISGGPRTHLRYHPLVREFLEARLRTTDGSPAVAALHQRVGDASAASDWRIAAYHYREAEATTSLLRVLGGAIPTILGNGQYALAEAFIRPLPIDLRPRSFDLILSRVDMQQGDFEAAISASQAVLDSDATDRVQRDHALLNLTTLYLNLGDGERADRYAKRLVAETDDDYMQAIGKATELSISASNDGDLDESVRHLTAMALTQRDGNVHHYGVTMLNLSLLAIAQDDDAQAQATAQAALEALSTSSGHWERTCAAAALATSLIRRGDVAGANQIIAEHVDAEAPEVVLEFAASIDSFGGSAAARALMTRVTSLDGLGPMQERHRTLVLARHAIRTRDWPESSRLLNTLDSAIWTDFAFESARLVSIAHYRVAAGSGAARQAVSHAMAHARSQKAHSWRRLAEVLSATLDGGESLSAVVTGLGQNQPWHLTFLSELMVTHLDDVSDEALSVVLAAARLHPERWRGSLRAELERSKTSIRAAQMLEEIGEQRDVALLRGIARKRSPASQHVSNLGRRLSKRVAARVYIEDQGRVSVRVGKRVIAGSEIRRKVLALTCFLVTRPALSATRDQVLEAIWPDLDPAIAVNSLNQTLYFLRRVFEEHYNEDLSPGYVHHDSEVIWLDTELVRSRSVESREFIRGLDLPPSPDQVRQLVALYRGRFALDFEYEDWSSAYRDSMHAAYLEVVERAVHDDFEIGHYDRAIVTARHALEIEPGAENIEVSLLRLYRVTGAHAAAAEQYAHYAAVMRDELGLEPPPLEAL